MVQLILRPSAPFSHPSHPARALLCSRPDLHHLHDHQRGVQLSDFSSHRVVSLSLSVSVFESFSKPPLDPSPTNTIATYLSKSNEDGWLNASRLPPAPCGVRLWFSLMTEGSMAVQVVPESKHIPP